MVKVTVATVKRNYVISSKELKKFLGIKNPEKITSFGCWVSRSPHNQEHGIDPDSVDEWYVTTKVQKEGGHEYT